MTAKRHQASAASARARTRQLARPARAAASRRYFKTGPGEYGAGDHFLGLTVPQLRQLAREFGALPIADLRAPHCCVAWRAHRSCGDGGWR
jgi:hypothetical protein